MNEDVLLGFVVLGVFVYGLYHDKSPSFTTIQGIRFLFELFPGSIEEWQIQEKQEFGAWA